MSFTFHTLGRPVEASDPASRQSLDYDASGRVVRAVQESAAGKLETVYTHDLLGRLVGARKTLGGQLLQTERRVWDAAHRLVEQGVRLGDSMGAGLVEQVTRYEWNTAHRLVRRTLPNGIEQRWTYDRAGRVTRALPSK